MAHFTQTSNRRKSDSDADYRVQRSDCCAVHEPTLVNCPLPANLAWRVDAYGLPYIVDHNNGTTSREDPRSPLPDIWERRHNIIGEMYFFNHNTGISTWQHPFCRCYFPRALGELPGCQRSLSWPGCLPACV